MKCLVDVNHKVSDVWWQLFNLNIILQNVNESEVELNDADTDDLCEIIQSLLPKAPEFSVLLKAQLMNAKSGDPRGHRWDPKIISLCLHLWAK